MRTAAISCAFFISAISLLPASRAPEQYPLWSIDLSAYPHGQLADDIVVKITGRFLVIYPDRTGSRLVFDIFSHENIPTESLAEMLLPARDEPGLIGIRKPLPAVNTIRRWKQMTIEQVGGVGMGDTSETEYYLQQPGGERNLLLRSRCNGDPSFVGDEYIFFHLCNGKKIVVNAKGQKMYGLSLSDPYLLPNREGNRFVAYERRKSAFHPFGGTEEVRAIVYRSVDGKKLFERRWRLGKYEGVNDGRVALSDDGTLLAVAGAGEVMIFQVPAER